MQTRKILPSLLFFVRSTLITPYIIIQEKAKALKQRHTVISELLLHARIERFEQSIIPLKTSYLRSFNEFVTKFVTNHTFFIH